MPKLENTPVLNVNCYVGLGELVKLIITLV